MTCHSNIRGSVEKMKESFQSFQCEGSGWQLQEVRIFVIYFVITIRSYTLKDVLQTLSLVFEY